LIGQEPRYEVAPFPKTTILAFCTSTIWVWIAYLRSKIFGGAHFQRYSTKISKAVQKLAWITCTRSSLLSEDFESVGLGNETFVTDIRGPKNVS